MAIYVEPVRWRERMEELAEEAERVFFERVLLGALYEMARVIITETPYRTGRARGNYDLALNGESPGQGDFDENRFDDGTATLRRIIDKARTADGPYQLMWIYNLTPYVIWLDVGTSKMRAKGMSEKAITAGERFVRRATR